MKKVLSLVMACTLTVSMILTGSWLGGTSEAAAADDQNTINEIAEQFGDPSNDPFDYTRDVERKKAARRAAALPDKYDLRNVDGTSYVTPVKFQNPFGNCWGFAAIAAAETSILGDEETRGDYVARGTDDPSAIPLDLSEKHLTYFARNPINDPTNPQNGEGESAMTLSPDEDPVAAAYNMGGEPPLATSMFAAGAGPVLESENVLFEYHGKNGRIQKDWVDGSFQKYEDSEDDDWSLDESLRFSSSFSLRESFVVPSPAKITESDFENIYEFNEDGVNAIKDQLYHNRGVQIGYQDDTFIPDRTDHSDFINSNYAHYTYQPKSPRHAVCIVGWDDTYPKENFEHEVDPNDEGITKETTIPPGDGAWLVKNSWGSGEEEFPNKGEGTWGIRVPLTDSEGNPVLDDQGEPKMVGSGYFWLSYYDQSIATPEALDFEVNTESSETFTDRTDQHDLMPIGHYLAAKTSSEVKTANVFKASTCEEIRKVSCETTYPGTEVTFDVYLLANEYTSPTEGLLMDTVTSTFEYGGFHKVDLNKPFMVMRGQSYAIVVTEKVPVESGTSYAVGVKLGTGTGVINKGESFILTDGSWQDLSDKSLQKNLTENVEDAGSADVMDNFPIKGFGKEMPDIVLEVNYSGFISLPEPGEEEIPEAYFKAWITDNSGSDDTTGVEPVWEILEGGDGAISLADGRDPSRKTLTCKRLGRDYIVVTAEGIGQVIHLITVAPHNPEITATKTGKDSIDLTLDYKKQEGLSGIEVAYRAKGSSSWSKKEFKPDASTFRISGLTAGKKYELKVKSYVESAYGRLYSDEADGLSGLVGLPNTLKASGKTVKVKYSALKKANVKIAGKKAIAVSKAQGAVTYKKVSVSKKKFAKKFSVNKKTGKITIKKGLKKGTYKVKVKVTAAGRGKYIPGSKTVTVKVKVK